MKYAALAAAVAAAALPEAAGFSASGALPLRGSQLPSTKVGFPRGPCSPAPPDPAPLSLRPVRAAGAPGGRAVRRPRPCARGRR